jgi:predicted transposase YdaD
MIKVWNLRETRVWQEAKAEGKAEGRMERGQEIALHLLKEKFSPSSPAQFTGLTLRQVQRLCKILGNSVP